jgi:hypothetical protein
MKHTTTWPLLLLAPAWLAACRQLGSQERAAVSPDLDGPRVELEEARPDTGLELPHSVPTALVAEHADRALWLAGRPRLAGLPAARVAERDAEKERALARLRDELSPEGTASRQWNDHVVAVLRRPAGERDALWCAAARAAGRLGRYDLAPLIAGAWASAGDALRTEAARESLHDLYGRWFADLEEARPFLEGVGPGPATELLVSEALEGERAARDHLFSLLEHEPGDAVQSLADPDPQVRAGAARVLGAALTSSRVERAPTVAAIFERLDLEADARAYDALVGALAALLESESPADPDVARLRAHVTESGGDHRTLSVARTLARLPWRTDGPETDGHLQDGIAVLGRLLGEIVAAERDRGEPDSDALMETLLALETLAARAEDAGLAEGLRRSPARRPVFELVRDSDRDEAVRIAAGETLGAFALPEDWPFLIEALRRGDATPALGHALLGALRAILLELEPGDPGVDQVLSEVATLTAAEDPDLRRRALTLLADPVLAPLVERLPPEFLVERLRVEEVPDLSRLVIGLVRRFGTPAMLPLCMRSERFEILASDPENLAELSEMCAVLAAGRPAETMEAATRLVGVDAGDLRYARVRQALALVARLGEEKAERLSAEEHRRVCAWAWQLHVSGVPLAEATPALAGDELTGDAPRGDVAFVERLVHVHWPRSGAWDGEVEFDEAARLHLLAVALGTLVVERAESADASDLEALAAEATSAYERALRSADQHGSSGFDLVVLRDRARFLASTGESVRALTDYRTLVDEDALEIPDLRSAIELLQSVGGASGRRVVAPETFDLRFRLVERDAWRDEPSSVRMQDLRDLLASALRSADLGRIERFAEGLRGLPEQPLPVDADEGPGALHPDRLWTGLAREARLLEELHALADTAHRSLPEEPQVEEASQPVGDGTRD